MSPPNNEETMPGDQPSPALEPDHPTIFFHNLSSAASHDADFRNPLGVSLAFPDPDNFNPSISGSEFYRAASQQEVF